MNKLPYLYIPADGPMTPVVVSVPHSGLRIPDEDKALIISDERTMLRDADLHVDRLYRNAANLGADLLVATVSRYVLDLNRSPEDVDAKTCPEFPTPARENPRALVWRKSTDGRDVQARPLTLAEINSRIERVHTPYHAKLRSLLDARVAKFGYAILLDAHSMPSVGRETHSDTGKRRADAVPGNNKGSSCADSLTQLVVEHFEAHEFHVALNDPYSGGWITRNYGQPHNNVHAIQVELNRALYLHEEVPFWAGAPALELQVILDALVQKILAYTPD
ncbi:MAG: N-formylglutamate deformylase [Myxococcota bacterium]|jgi:N-formylglutamate deformylase